MKMNKKRLDLAHFIERPRCKQVCVERKVCLPTNYYLCTAAGSNPAQSTLKERKKLKDMSNKTNACKLQLYWSIGN